MANADDVGTESAQRPKLDDPNNGLRKLQRDNSFHINLGTTAEDAGFEPGDRVIFDIDGETGSIVVLEAAKEGGEWPEDARKISQQGRRVTVPSSIASILDIDFERYDPTVDPVVLMLEPYPDEEDYPSAIEVVPLGYASGILDDDGRLLPPEDRVPEGKRSDWQPEYDELPVLETNSSRDVTTVGIGRTLVTMVADHHDLAVDDYWESLSDVASLDSEFFEGREEVPSIPGDGRNIHFATEGTWDEIVDHLDLPSGHLEVVRFGHEREAEFIIGEVGAENYFELISETEPVVLPD